MIQLLHFAVHDKKMVEKKHNTHPHNVNGNRKRVHSFNDKNKGYSFTVKNLCKNNKNTHIDRTILC